MCPKFKNININLEDTGEYTKSYAEENKIMVQPCRSLIGRLKGEKILLPRFLLYWNCLGGVESLVKTELKEEFVNINSD